MLALTLGAAGCSRSGAQQPQFSRRGDMVVPVAVDKAARRDVPVQIQVIGNVEAYSTVTLMSQVTGLIARVHFREGDYVRKGDPLFTVDPSPFQAQLDEAVANLAKAEATLAQAQAALKRDIAQAEFSKSQAGRYTKLLELGIMSKDQTEQIQSGANAQAEAVRADEATIKSNEAAVVAARAAVQTTKIQLGYTGIRSPIEGRTGNLSLKEGNLVAANTTPLVTINQVEPIYVTFSVPEGQLAAVKQYMAAGRLPVSVSPQDGTPLEETGTLTFVDNAVDPSTGTIKLKATFPNADRKLWPGQFVRVTVRLTTQKGAVVVPNQAVQTGQDGPFVYVVKQDNTVESRPVALGARLDQLVAIERGLEPGETVVTEGQLRLAPGMHVRLRGAGGPEGGPRRRPRT